MLEILLGFLKIGATGYGGPAIIGIMQTEFKERRQWTSKPRFLASAVLLLWRVAPLRAMAGGAAFGIIRDRVWAR